MRSWILMLALAIPLAADTVTYTYDEAGRLSRVDYGNGKTITYAYDKSGNLLTRVIAAGSTAASESANAPAKKAKPKESARKAAGSTRR